MGKLEKIQQVKALLRGGRRRTAREMAEHMGCDERTVRRCADYLRDVERWPLEAGKDGYWLREASSAEARISSHEEVAALAMAFEALRSLAGREHGEMLREELERLCRVSEDLGGFRWKDLDGLIDHRESGGAVVDYAVQGALIAAVLQRQPLEITYRRAEVAERFSVRVFPHRLICRDQCWYLIGTDLQRGGQKVYALPRIYSVEVIPRGEDFQEPKFTDFYQHAFGIWSPMEEGRDLYDVCVEISGYWAEIARERMWHPSQRIEEISADRVQVKFRVSELVEVKSWVLRFGSAARVIAPEALREMIREELAEMNRNHDLS